MWQFTAAVDGTGQGRFGGGADLPAPYLAPGLALGDVDGDSNLHLLTGSDGSNTVSVRLNGGDASGSNTGVFSQGSLVVHAEAGLVRQPVFVVGLEHPARPAIDYEALALLGLSATQQLAAAQQVNGALLLDHAEQEDLKQQLHLLRSQQAAQRQRRLIGWSAA